MTEIKFGDFLLAILQKQTCIFSFFVLNFWLILLSLCRHPIRNSLFSFLFITFSFPWRLLDKHMDRVKMVWPFSIIEEQ